jgi:Arc/MetJ-type ribon-helix-helix transcriptional regulator
MRGKRHLKDNEAMTIELTKEQQRMIDLAVASGAYHSSDEVIDAALAMLHEDIEDGNISDARAGEPRFTLDEVEAELRALGKIK